MLESGFCVESRDVSLIVGNERKVVALTEDKLLMVVSLIVGGEGGFVGVIVIDEVLEIVFSTREFVALEDIS